MSKKIVFSILVIFIICIGIYFYNSKNQTNNSINHKELLHTIDSLNYKIDSLSLYRETLILKIDSSKLMIPLFLYLVPFRLTAE